MLKGSTASKPYAKRNFPTKKHKTHSDKGKPRTPAQAKAYKNKLASFKVRYYAKYKSDWQLKNIYHPELLRTPRKPIDLY